MSTNFTWSKTHKKCNVCGTIERKHKAKGLCTRCYQKQHDYPKEYCSICGKYSRVHKRNSGNPVCQSCYNAPTHECKICRSVATSALKLTSTDFICDNCYTKYYKSKYECSICGSLETASVNTENTKVCYKCYTPPNNICEQCGRNIRSPYKLDEKHICHRCYESNQSNYSNSKINIATREYICTICGQVNNVQKIFSDGSLICQVCFKNQHKICSSCKNENTYVYSYINAFPYCRECYFSKVYILVLDAIKKECSGNFFNILEAYYNSKLSFFTTETIYNSIVASKDLFLALYVIYKDNDFKFNNIDFNKLYKRFSNKKIVLNDFIYFLKKENLLLSYDTDIRLLNQLDTIIDRFPTDLKKLIISYKDWLLSKSQHYKIKGWVGKDSKFVYYTCYQYLLTTLRFFMYIHNEFNIKQPTQINNHIVDSYLSSKPYDRGNLRHLIRYMNSKKATFSHITLPFSNYKHELFTGLNLDKQKELVDQIFFNESISKRNRILIFLMLLYGYTPQEIQDLKRNNFIITSFKSENEVLLLKNAIQYKIPSSIAPMIYEYLSTLNKDFEYVFPGRYLNKALSLSSIYKILKIFNITSKELYYTAVNNSMINGIYQPSLLMKMYRIHFTTATRYYNLIDNLYNLD